MKWPLLLAFVLFSLWDIYRADLGGRFLDYFGLAIVILRLGGQVVISRAALSVNRGHLLYLMVVAVYCGWSLVAKNYLTAGAIFIGALLIYPVFADEKLDRRRLATQLDWLIVINLVLFYLQVIAFRVFGQVLNYHEWLGVAVRIWNRDLWFFRAAGAYQEPNSFCLTMIMLLGLRIAYFGRRVDWILWASVFALVFSNSLWGIVGAGIVLALALPSARSAAMVGGALGMAVVLSAAAGTTIWDQAKNVLFDPLTLTRIEYLADDPSVSSRYGGGEVTNTFVSLLFGNGPSTTDFQALAGANGYGFLIYSFGFVGTLAFVFWLVNQSMNAKGRIAKPLLVGFLLSSYPLFTYLWWWAWLGLYLRASPEPAPALSGRRMPSLRPAALLRQQASVRQA